MLGEIKIMMRRKKLIVKVILICVAILLLIGIYCCIKKDGSIIKDKLEAIIDKIEIIFKKEVKVPEEYSLVDKNNNGIADPIDIVNQARNEIKKKTQYKSNYYVGGYPPEGEGVCTDVVWRALKGANINLKEMIDKDIKENIKFYKRVEGKPDPNIDFRRVLNQDVYFKRNCTSLTTELKQKDIDNLKQWQPGDIVVFIEGYEHVAVVSDKRDRDGIPYVIHNSPPYAREAKLSWFEAPIHGHYRWKY